MKRSVALCMKKIMLEKGRQTVWYGDIELIEECAKISGIKSNHPKNVIKTVMDQLEFSPDFSKSYITADFSGSVRRYRCFKLIGTVKD